MNELQNALIDYGLRLMQQATGVDPGAHGETAWAGEFERRMGGEGNAPIPSGPCHTIFTRLIIDKKEPPLTHWMPQPLAIEGRGVDPQPADSPQDYDRAALGRQFAQAMANLDRAEPHAFLCFQHLMQLYASTLPNNHRVNGSSLFQQWKAVAALAWIAGNTAGPPANVLLVSGDLPGIQRAIYTISSKGAAKTLRGRSFFVQLLGDAAVRRLLDALGLCEANVIYAAGGNFLLAAQPGQEAIVAEAGEAINRCLLDAFDGALHLALAWETATTATLFDARQFLNKREKLGAALAAAKHSPFASFVDDWQTLWEPEGVGGTDHCAITGVELGKDQGVPLEPKVTPGTRPTLVTPLVKSLLDLAYAIRHPRLQMTVTREAGAVGKAVLISDEWDGVLAKLSGYRYHFSPLPDGWKELSFAPGVLAYALNEPEAVAHGFHGFRFIANVTPQATAEDVDWWASSSDEEPSHVGDIRNFAMLAHAAKEAKAIERVGVLRMDVDNLGQIFGGDETKLTMLLLGELSQALERFFGGRLNAIVRQTAGNDAYVIYAGGDDLFIVGAWHVLPALAEAIRDAFHAFNGQHPTLSISGGITLEQPKFPIYRAARRAEEAEERAKDFVRYRRMEDGRLKLENGQRVEAGKKNALCFLGEVVTWEEWPLVRQQQQALLELIQPGKEGQKALPKATLHVVRTLHRSYADDLAAARRRYREQAGSGQQRPATRPDERQFYGRWRWMQAYALGRIAQRHSDREDDLTAMQQALLKPETIRLAGLAARWAEYRIRTEE